MMNKKGKLGGVEMIVVIVLVLIFAGLILGATVKIFGSWTKDTEKICVNNTKYYKEAYCVAARSDCDTDDGFSVLASKDSSCPTSETKDTLEVKNDAKEVTQEFVSKKNKQYCCNKPSIGI